jgi:mRNA-degrading endonuclease YafQ of YafQ-DinJ toxin-antitoxin module
MREIKTTAAFDKKLSKYFRKYPEMAKHISNVFKSLQIDISDPVLKVHKLKDELKMYYACSINYSHRIVFRYDDNFIYMQAVGPHDWVY